jgi:hypothetical protein
MRRFILIAAAAAIALVGLSANQCGGAGDKADDTPAKQDDSMSNDSMPDDSMSDDGSMSDETPQ